MPEAVQEIEPNTQRRTELQVSGMTCQNCARHVAEAVRAVPGVTSATVSLPQETVSVRWSPGAQLDTSALVSSLDKAGYPAKVVGLPAQEEASCHSPVEKHDWQATLWIGVAGMLFLMAGEWIFGLQHAGWFRWCSFAVATLVQVFAGSRFYRGAWNQLKHGRSNMDTLVALGSTTAFAYSVWILLSGSASHLYFMEAASIISLVSLGHWLEERVSRRAQRSLETLLQLAPSTARRLRGGAEEEVPVRQIKPEDRVVLRPGDRVPVDGAIEEGAGSFDESMLTGESMPLDKNPADLVYAGTLNLTGRVTVRVTATGEATALANVIAAVERAQNSRANIQRLGDRVSSVFVPIVVTIAIAAGFLWAFAPETAQQLHGALARFLWHAQVPEERWAAAFIIPAAILIVACPCAMGLATPAAIMAASNSASRRGILIRDGVALEKAGRVTAVLFDKTGTLTAGKPKVAATFVAPESERLGVDPLSVAAALAQLSTHPLSQAIAATVSAAAGIIVDSSTEVRGGGIEAEIVTDGGKSETARLGSLRWLGSKGVTIAEDHPFVLKWTDEAASLVGVAAGNRLLCLFALKDTLKPDAQNVIRELSESGLRIYLVTGDNRRTAQSIARQLALPAENVFAEIRPEEKAEVVKKLQAEGQHVAFVGDGINDAPALEQADLGIAVSRANEVAREAADIVLLNSEISAVPQSLSLARSTLRVIKQNLFWAFFYNALGIPLAALGFMSPILCAAAMGLSDVVVIGNALRLLRR